MIFFKPHIISLNPERVTFTAFENNAESGSCELVIKGDNAEIVSLSCDSGEHNIIEGLIKSAFNYACSKNCYMGYCRCVNIDENLNRMNFMKKDDFYYNDIPSILMGNCCKKHL